MDDFWNILTLEAQKQDVLPSDVTVKMIMDTWTNQIGYPVVQVQRNDDAIAIIKQVRKVFDITVLYQKYLLTNEQDSVI